jgi:dTDP-4-dehydrorhamnose reductase
MRIVITGITGQVGSALVSRLASLGTIIPADRTMLDLAQPDTIADTLDRLAPDLIINPAAYTAVDKSEDEPELAMCVNGRAPGIVAGWSAKHAVPFIHFSTDYVYDGRGERAWGEDDPVCPLSIYGRSKLAGENAVRTAGGCFLVVRTSWVYAAQGKNFLRTVTRLAQERKALRIVADQIGAPTSAALIAEAIFAIVADGLDRLRDRCAQAKGLVHLAARGETSWHGFACAIVEGLRRHGAPLAVADIIPIGTAEYPTRAKRPHNSRLDLARLKTVFGIAPPFWKVALAIELDKLAKELVEASEWQRKSAQQILTISQAGSI